MDKKQKKTTRRRRRSGQSEERQNERTDAGRPRSAPPSSMFATALEDSAPPHEEPVPSTSREVQASSSSPKRPKESTPPDTKHRPGTLQKMKDMVTFKRSQNSSPSKSENAKAKEKALKFPFLKRVKTKSPVVKPKKPAKPKDDLNDDMTKHLLENMERDSSSSALDSSSMEFPVVVKDKPKPPGFENPKMVKGNTAPVGYMSDDYVDSQSTESSSLFDAMLRQHISQQKSLDSNQEIEESAELGATYLEGETKLQDAEESVPLLPQNLDKETPASSDDENSSGTPEKERKKRKK